MHLTLPIVAVFSLAAVTGTGQCQDYSAPPEAVPVSEILSEELEKLPKEPANVLCGMDRVKKFRREITAARTNRLLVLETRRNEFCEKLSAYDAETERLTESGIIGPSVRATRKTHYRDSFDQHCDPGVPERSPPRGLIDIYRVINSRISALEVESKELIDECHGDGSCSINRCEG